MSRVLHHWRCSALQAAAQDDGWLAPISSGLNYSLQQIQTGLDQLHVPYSYGWAIIVLTVGTKILTFPFTKVESALAVQKLKPTIDAIKRQYGEDKNSIQRETSALYEASGVNPAAGCLPTLATIPIFWGLYRTLSNVASAGLLTEGFYWIPSLSGPTSLAAQRAGTGTAWLFPFVDGAPPVGWEDAARYLALPIALVAAQFASSAVISPPIDDEDKNAAFSKGLLIAVPFMVGWFALNVPSGLSLYYFSNTIITSGIQIWLRKLGGAYSPLLLLTFIHWPTVRACSSFLCCPRQANSCASLFLVPGNHLFACWARRDFYVQLSW
ncbi:hypothetical protein COCSUDRAFT_12888 [Coccomyxa subellipsoidea C-169]|uniref:Membrane insertase YidC/Oxa/ALB C-terminal domain-containing protein n=1 Tax=Coccomyxa subellipsoidea (strain C-169) TaxID=574566 RepID=I0Z532_COCSC|nr:hypothetical protein COCSUDRAFT_12888 [Coccomyxa subellipsoidea C-169]EIE25751.1 hypothetical protein COCSUDRAFT_12888 [Coccomyxa subellipsoidea C-169]|eukprot:XP_005650295.1 hypothetical protein COCSUDRAFT_12888 [Coccomyxa subellipsoidea C-169]